MRQSAFPPKSPGTAFRFAAVFFLTAILLAFRPVQAFSLNVFGTPALISPADISTPLSLRPAFDWSDEAGATKYNIQISRNNVFTLLVVNTTTLSSGFTPASNLPANTSLYWRVRVSSPAVGTWSSVWQFNSPNPPSTPGLFTPSNNSLTTNYTPVFDWANSALPLNTTFDHYQIQVDDNSDFSSPVIDAPTTPGDINDSHYTGGPSLADNTKYYWHVQAVNQSGQYSTWSTAFTLRAAILPPVLTGPADTTVLPNKRPVFSWNPAVGASGYNIQISRNNTFTLLVSNVALNGVSFMPGADLPGGLALYWRVRATGLNGPSVWSSVLSFTTGNPPSVPALGFPYNGGLTTDYTPVFDWANSALPLNTTFDHYQIQVDDNSDFNSPAIDDTTAIGDINDSDYTPGSDLSDNTKYYWRVRSHNTSGDYSTWSVLRYFRTAILPPNSLAPGQVVPGPADPLYTRRTTFAWGPVTGATSYSVEYSTVSNFSSKTSASSTNTSFTPNVDLIGNAVYYWRVRANGLNGPSLYSQGRNFKTGNPPSIPSLISPANNAVLNSKTVLFDWSNSAMPAGATFDHYEIQVSTSNTFAATIVDASTPSLDVTASNYTSTSEVSENTVYYWRVRSWDQVNAENHYSTWSAVRTLRIGIFVPILDLQTFATGFSYPVYITNAGDGTDRVFVVEKCGTIKIIEGGSTLATDFLDITGRVGCTSERGLLSMTFPPNYAAKGYFYIFYTDAAGTLTVSRFSVPSGTPDEADVNSEQVILTIPHPAGNHNGGQLAFGNDGYLYISTGDGGGGGDPSNNAQNPNVLLGKILRIDVEGGVAPYAVPPTNPFYGVIGKKPEIWAMGLRNPWRFSFDRQTHDLYIGDVGQNSWEEVDFRPASSTGGENYGWRLREGNHCYSPSSGCGTPPNYVPPIKEYSHLAGCAVTGGFVYRGSTYPDLQGFYVYGDYCSGNIWVLKQAYGIWYGQKVLSSGLNPSTFGEDEQGNLYLADLYTGTIYIVEASP